MIVIRAFVGIDFGSDCKKYIYELQQRLRKYAVKGRWKHSDNFHLTLKFLDEINLKQQRQIDEALHHICAEHNAFGLEMSALGIFGAGESIRVLWLGLAGDLDILRLLAGKIDASLAEIGFPPEKRSYAPHITIGQDIVFECPFDQIRDSIGHEKPCPIDVKEVTLFKSEQLMGRRIYTKVSEYGLISNNPPRLFQ